jgi:hypothetical protein
MNIEKVINVEYFKTISLDEALTLRGSISKEDITKVWKKLNPKRKSKVKESNTEQESE